MTLVLALSNVDYAIHVSDRQLTAANGRTQVLSEVKSTVLILNDARLICSFTGLARAGRFKTARWVLEALAEAGKDDHLAERTIRNFADLATAKFRESEILRRVKRVNRGLTVMFTGYIDLDDGGGFPVAAMVSNCQNFNTGLDEPPWNEFRIHFAQAKTPVEPHYSWIQRVGTWQAVGEEDLAPIRAALEQRKPPNVVELMAVGLVRKVADRPEAGGFVGKDLQAAIISSRRPPLGGEHGYPIIGELHPTDPAMKHLMVNQVVSTDEVTLLIMDPEMTAVDAQGNREPVVIPRVGRNARCPCGSGRKYKRCHGR